MVSTYCAAFGATYISIALRAFQQLNVIHDNRMWVIPASVGMAACEVLTVALMVKEGWGWIVLWIGFGGGLGTLTSMWLHKRIRG